MAAKSAIAGDRPPTRRRSMHMHAGALALLSAVLAAVLVSISSGKFARVALDELNPFGSVDDNELPDQLGQPPTLSAMLHTEYPPGYNQNGQPIGRNRMPSSTLSQVYPPGYKRNGQPSSIPSQASHPGDKHTIGLSSQLSDGGKLPAWAEAEIQAEERTKEQQARARMYARMAPPPTAPGTTNAGTNPAATPAATPAGTFSGAVPRVGATQAERDYWAQAQGSYFRALNHFYNAESAGLHSEWVARRSGWASNAPEAAAHAADGDKLLNEAAHFYNQGKQVAEGEQLATDRHASHTARQHQEEAAERDYMQALVYLDKSTKAAGATTTAPEWQRAQEHWDYFYQTNRVLNGKQQRLDVKRAQMLREFLPRSDTAAAIKIDAYIAPWVPFPACHTHAHAKQPVTHASSRALRALRRVTALHASKHPTNDSEWRASLKALCYAAAPLSSSARASVEFTPVSSKEGEQLQMQTEHIKSQRARKAPSAAAATRNTRGRGKVQRVHNELQAARAGGGGGGGGGAGGGEERRVQKELDAAMSPLNQEQARLNRARLLLYVKQYGPMRALFSATPPARKAALWFPGDFEQPRNDDCEDPGACHDWADGAYIDSFAAATTNWDSMGQPTPGYLHWDTLADDLFEGPQDTVRDGGNLNVRWRASHTETLLQIPSAAADESFDWQGFNAQQLQLEQRAQDAAKVLMSRALQNFPPQKLLADAASTEKLQSGMSGKGSGWFETHSANGAPLPTTASGMLGVDAEWRPPAGLPFGGNIASKPLSFGTFGHAAHASTSAAPASVRAAEEQEAADLRAKLNGVQKLMDEQWAPDTHAQPAGAADTASTDGDGISGRLLDDLNAPLRNREQREEAESAARAASRAAHETLGMASGLEQYGDIASLQKPVLDAHFKRQVEQADDAIDAALNSKIVAHTDDPAAPNHRGTLASGNLAAPPPPPAASAAMQEAMGAPAPWDGAEEGELAEVLQLRARLKRQRDANRRLEQKLTQAQREGFGTKYASRLKDTEERVAAAVAKQLSPQVLTRAALVVAKQVERQQAAEKSTSTQILGSKKARKERRDKGLDTQDKDPYEDRYDREVRRMKNVRDGDDQDINYRRPRGSFLLNGKGRDGQDAFDKGKEGKKDAKDAKRDAKNADRNAKAAYAAAMIRDVTQGGGGYDGVAKKKEMGLENGEEVADDAPRYRWVHHRNQVYRSGVSQNWARDRGSELPEQQQAWAKKELGTAGTAKADQHAWVGRGRERGAKRELGRGAKMPLGANAGMADAVGGEPMWGRSRQKTKPKHESMRGAYYDYAGRDKWPYARPVSDHWRYARRRAENAAVKAQKVEAAKIYPADENYDAETAAHAKFCHDSPEKCVPGGMSGESAEERRRRTRSGIARKIYDEHSEAEATGKWHTSGTKEERERRGAHEPIERGFAKVNATEWQKPLTTMAGVPEGLPLEGVPAGAAPKPAWGKANQDNEPWEIRGAYSTTDRGQRHWQAHYFNHAFWSQLYHYFKGDKPSEYCNVCVGEFMTALQDIKDPITGVQRHARAEQVPAMCQGVCESNQALGYKFHRAVPTEGESNAYMKRARLLQHVAETEDEREKTYKREYRAYVHAPPKEGDYVVTRMEPTPEGATHAGVLRETRDLRQRERAAYGDRGFAETNGGRRRFRGQNVLRTQSTRQVASGAGSSDGGSSTGSTSSTGSHADDMPVSAAVQMDLKHTAEAAAAAAAAAAVAVPAASVTAQANAQDAADADSAYSPGGAVKIGNHPQRATAAAAAAAVAAAEEDKKERRKIERDDAIMGGIDKAPTSLLAQVPYGEELKSFEAARQANELQRGGYA